MIMTNTISLIKEADCYGCGACYNKCPCNAIVMKANHEGFLFPEIDSEKCINCGLCLKACPVQTHAYKNSSSPECYAVLAKDELRLKSSSGAAFSLMAEYIFSQNGYVCGASFNSDYTAVEHIIVSNNEGLEKLRGSKYVQSNTLSVYAEIETLLKENKTVLFTGCPCQIAGLYSFLGKNYEKLYTADLVCHGVPSPKAYKKFIQQFKNHGTIANVSFRDKRKFGWNVSATIEYENGEIDQKSRSQSSWMKSFLGLISLRKSCGHCQFAKIPRQGDITLADFWDIDKYKKSLDDKKGTSLILVNNEKGQVLFDFIQKTSILCEAAPLEHAKKYNSQLHSSSLLHPRRERFFKLLDLYDFDKAVDYGMNRRFDIGYVGWWYGQNYGSALTNYALHETLISMGKTVLMLDWPEHEKPQAPPAVTKTRKFAKKHYDMSMRYTYEELPRLNYHCDTFLVGSDQLWNYYSVKENGYYFFLDFVEKSKRKVAYATSFGHTFSFFPEYQNIEICKLLSQFNTISVREKEGIDICRNSFGVNAVQTLDPVFLCDLSAYDKAIADASVKENTPYLLAYILDPTNEKRKMLLHAANCLNLPLKVILDGQDDFEINKEKMNLDCVLNDVGIEDWLYYFKNAAYIITDSFHGLCFSILFEKQFICIGNKKRGMSRFNTLLNTTGLTDRMLLDLDGNFVDSLLEKNIDFKTAKIPLYQEKVRSLKWLDQALNSPNVKQPSIASLLADRITALEAELALQKKQLAQALQKEIEPDPSNFKKNIDKVQAYYQKYGVKRTIQHILEKLH